MLMLKMALRGLWRHKMRTAITLGAVAFGYFLFLVFMCVNDGGHEHMIEIALRQSQAGHVVVQAKGYQKSRSVELIVPDAERIRSMIKKRRPRATVTLRAFGGGLIRTSSDSVGVFFSGVEPAIERHASDLAKNIKEGVYLHAKPAEIQRAVKKRDGLWCAWPTKPGEPRRSQVVIGVQLAKTLRVDLCGKVVVDAQGMGNRESQAFRVVGIFKTGNIDLDGRYLQLPLEDAQRLMHLGTSVHQVAVFVKSAKESKPLAAAIRRDLGKQGGVVVLAWDKALPELAEFIWLDEASGWIFIIILFVIMATGVLNTVLMSVMERTRELGVMRALGTGPGRIMGQVLCEGVLLGLLGVAIGALLSIYPIWYLETVGLDMREFTDEAAMEVSGFAMTVIKGKLYASAAIWSSVAVLVMAVLSSIYPAIRAARVHILKAIHHV